MKIIKTDAVIKKNLTGDPLMTGGAVEATFLITPDIAKELGMGIVKFAPGARTKFHTHTSEQLLYCIEGKGVVATEKEEITVTKGSVVYFPAGENHWHGASKDSSFAHLSIAPPHKTNITEK
jgi:quercetin dioxygenase-like cupin family protein